MDKRLWGAATCLVLAFGVYVVGSWYAAMPPRSPHTLGVAGDAAQIPQTDLPSVPVSPAVSVPAPAVSGATSPPRSGREAVSHLVALASRVAARRPLDLGTGYYHSVVTSRTESPAGVSAVGRESWMDAAGGLWVRDTPFDAAGRAGAAAPAAAAAPDPDGIERLSASALKAVPTKAAPLAEWVRGRVKTTGTAAARTFAGLTRLASDPRLPPPLRAGVFRALAAVEGVTVSDARDARGRPATAIQLEGSDGTQNLMVNPGTGLVQQVQVHNRIDAGLERSIVVVQRSDITAQRSRR